MKIADLLRSVIDVLDQSDTENSVDNTVSAPKMIPPLQTKLELLKKVSGVESEYDDCDQESEMTIDQVHVSPEDELTRIKQLAGIHVTSEDTEAE